MSCGDLALRIKQGETFRQHCALYDGDAAEPITGWTLRCQVKRADGTLVETLSVTSRDDAAGTFVIASAGTAAWPTGTLYADILAIRADGHVGPSPTFTVTVEPRITVPS